MVGIARPLWGRMFVANLFATNIRTPLESNRQNKPVECIISLQYLMRNILGCKNKMRLNAITKICLNGWNSPTPPGSHVCSK